MPANAPIAVFAYQRSELLQQTLHALSLCDAFHPSRVHVFCDQAATARDEPAVAATRDVARDWCRQHGTRLVLRDANLHFANITQGLTELTESEGAVISLEDDHRPAAGFLAFLDHALARYRDEENVFQVAAAVPGPMEPGIPDTFFLPVPMPIGWGTWRRAWRCFDWDAAGSAGLLADPAARSAFDLDGAYPASRLLERALRGEFQSYFIRWYLAMFLRRGLALVSRRALVHNSGLDSGVHAMAPDAARDRFFNANWHGGEARLEHSWAYPAEIADTPEALAWFRARMLSWSTRRQTIV